MSIATITQDSIPSTIILHSQENRTVKETICDSNNNTLYSLPQEVPASASVLEIFPNGDTEWITASSIGNPNALINSLPSFPISAGQIPIFDGTNAFNVKSQDTVFINPSGDLQILEPLSGAISTIQTINSQTVLGNSGTGGVYINGQYGDILLSTTKFQGVVNVNAFSGLKINGSGNIRSQGTDLVIQNDTNVNINSIYDGIVLQAPFGTSINNTLTLQGLNNTGSLFVDAGETLNIRNDSGLGGTININTLSNGNILINAGSGFLQVNNRANFDDLLRTKDLIVSSGYELKLEDNTTAEIGTIREDTNGFLNVNNRFDVNISSTDGDIKLLPLIGNVVLSGNEYPNTLASQNGDVIRFLTNGTSSFSDALTVAENKYKTIYNIVPLTAIGAGSQNVFTGGSATQINLDANSVYNVEYLLFYSCTQLGGGIGFTFTTTAATPYCFNFEIQFGTTAGEVINSNLEAFNGTIAGTATTAVANTRLAVKIKGIVATTIAQSIILNASRDVGTGSITIHSANCLLTKLN